MMVLHIFDKVRVTTNHAANDVGIDHGHIALRLILMRIDKLKDEARRAEVSVKGLSKQSARESGDLRHFDRPVPVTQLDHPRRFFG
jgi:hypothetical protein